MSATSTKPPRRRPPSWINPHPKKEIDFIRTRTYYIRMSSPPKKKVNLTISGEILENARRVAEERGESLSSIVEDFLFRLSADMKSKGISWLDEFQQRYAPKHELSDQEVDALKKARAKRHHSNEDSR